MAGNELCGLDYDGEGTYTAEGITKLCEGSTITSLKYAAASFSNAFAFVSVPLNVHSSCTLPCRLVGNGLGPEGGAAIAEGLKGNSTLTSLE